MFKFSTRTNHSLNAYLAAILSQGLMAFTNASLAFVLARHFGGVSFNEYIAVTSVVLAISQVSKGFQSTTAAEFIHGSHKSYGLFHVGDGSALLFGLLFFIIWILFSPITILVLDTSPPITITAGLLLPAATMGYRAAGKYQGQRKFAKWQITTCITTLVQIPVVFVVLSLRAPVSVLVATLTIPSMLLFFWSTFDTRSVEVSSINFRVKNTFSSSFMAISTAVGLQIPLLFLKHHYEDSIVSNLTAISLLLMVIVGLSATFGSFLLPRFLLSPSRTFFGGFMAHLYTSLPSILLLLVFPFIGSWVIPFLFGPSYSGRISTATLFFVSCSYAVWTIVGSLVQERLGSVTFLRATIFGLISLTQILTVSSVTISIELYYVIHVLYGLLNLLFALSIGSKRQETYCRQEP
jgi:hypothetical protein